MHPSGSAAGAHHHAKRFALQLGLSVFSQTAKPCQYEIAAGNEESAEHCSQYVSTEDWRGDAESDGEPTSVPPKATGALKQPQHPDGACIREPLSNGVADLAPANHPTEAEAGNDEDQEGDHFGHPSKLRWGEAGLQNVVELHQGILSDVSCGGVAVNGSLIDKETFP